MEASADTPAREGEHVPPVQGRRAYHCPACGVLASQYWTQLYKQTGSNSFQKTLHYIAMCGNCNGEQVWIYYGTDIAGTESYRLVRPDVGGGPRPHVDMPDDVKGDYEEARSIVHRSPRGACALLRLATQKLADDLEEGSGKLNDKIGRLVEKGLPVMIQQALDSLRVIGNEAVHPGELDLKDDAETASRLFGLLNVIVENRITQPKLIAEFYATLPPSKLQGIEQRDGGITT
jgi:hypothetical protein